MANVSWTFKLSWGTENIQYENVQFFMLSKRIRMKEERHLYLIFYVFKSLTYTWTGIVIVRGRAMTLAWYIGKGG